MRLSFYIADEKYCSFLRQKDPRVTYTMDDKANRPFVGVVFEINNMKYYAPLTSPKPKHKKMKNQMDFQKINGGEWGAINFNNMIPIHIDSLKNIEVQKLPCITEEDKNYKNLLENQLSWCNAYKNNIISKAEKLYRIITDDKKEHDPQLAGLMKRCCNFKLNEARYIEYCKSNNFSLSNHNEQE